MSRARPTGRVYCFCEYGLTPLLQLRRVRIRNQSRAASTATHPETSTSRNDKTEDDSSSQDVALSPQQLRNQIRLATSADVWRRSIFGPHTVQRGRGISHRFLGYQERLKTEDMSDYAILRQERRARRAERQVTTSSVPETVDEEQDELDVAEQTQESESDDKLNTADFPSFIRLFDPENTSSSPKVSLQLLKSQLRSCTSPEDFTHVFSVILDTRPGMPNADGKGARLLGNSTVQRIVSQSLARYDAKRTLTSLSLLIRRLTEQEQIVDATVLELALETACRSLSLVAVRRYMQMHVDSQGGYLTTRMHLRILQWLDAGCQASTHETIAHAPILDILYSVPVSQDSKNRDTLRTRRKDLWPQWKTWVHLLVACRSVDSLRSEWAVVKDRMSGRKLTGDNKDIFVARSPRMFMKAFFDVGSPQDAWKIFEGYGDKIDMNDSFIWTRLMDHAENKPPLPDQLQKNLEIKVIERLSKGIAYVEREMGIRWVSGTNGEEGYHEVVNSLEDIEGDEDDATYVKAFARLAVEREEEILAQKDDILAGKEPRPYQEPFT